MRVLTLYTTVGGGGNEIGLELAFEPFLDDLHVQQPQKTGAKTKTQRLGCFHLELKGRIVELQFFQCGFERFVLRRFGGIQSAEDHGFDLLEARIRILCGIVRVSDGIAHGRIVQVLDATAHEPHFAETQFFHIRGFRGEYAQLGDLEILVLGVNFDPLALADTAVHDPEQHHNALVGIVPGVDDQGLERRIGIALGRRQLGDHLLQNLVHIHGRSWR